MHLATLISLDESGHGGDLRVVLVTEDGEKVSRRRTGIPIDDLRLGLLTVKGVDLTAHQHASKNKVLEDLNPLRATGLVVISE